MLHPISMRPFGPRWRQRTSTDATANVACMGNGADPVRIVDFGLGPYVHEAPSTRFPIYTRGNAGEVWPNVAYPLTMSLTREHHDPLGAAILTTGMVTADEFAGSVTSASCECSPSGRLA